MRTKALVLAAVLAAGSAITGVAQTVYSINAVGYVNLTIPAGFSMIANPLNTGTNKVGLLFQAPPNFTAFYKWNGATFDVNTYLFGGWSDTLGNPVTAEQTMTLNPGEGCFINSGEIFTNTFVGEVVQSPNSTTALSNSIPAGFSIRSSIVPQQGTADELGLTAAMGNFDAVYKFDTSVAGSYGLYTYLFGAWADPNNQPNAPTFKVGESFWINVGAATSWNRVFQVNTP